MKWIKGGDHIERKQRTFWWKIDNEPSEKEGERYFLNPSFWRISALNFATNKERWEFNAPGKAQGILQILHRDAKYYGLDGSQDGRGHFHEQEVRPMSLHSLVAQGGKVVIIGGRMNENWRRWEQDPRFEFWTGDRADIERRLPKGGTTVLPTNTHGIILSRFLSHAVVTRIINEARRRRLVIMGPKNDGEVTRLLEQITTPDKPVEQSKDLEPTTTQKAATLAAAEGLRPVHKGELTEYVKKYDDGQKPIIEVAKLVVGKMHEAGIRTTIASASVSVTNLRRALGIEQPPVPRGRPRKPAAPAPEPAAVQPMEDGTETLLKMIDDLMASMALMRDEVRRMHEQNKEYRVLEATLNKLGFIKKA